MAGYGGGRIKRIKIVNFMTYDDVEIYPKNGLNLIVGLNGSGKSSIMCAICLGLAGNPKFTGRAFQLSDFIKHGQQEAEIEIELESVRRNVVIRRKLRGDKTEWYLNKSPSNANEITTAVRSFNIDTSNLCQFLPQEKVIEFSRMDKKQRLENMLQAIGEPHLFELFNELKNLHKRCSDIDANIKKCELTKISAVERNERIKDEVKKQENRARLKEDLESLFVHRLLLQYNALKDEVDSLKKTRRELKKELSALCIEQKQALSEENSIFSQYTELSKRVRVVKTKVQELQGLMTCNSGFISNMNETVHTAKIEYNNRLTEKESQKKRLQDINIQIEGLEQMFQNEMQKKENIEELLEVNTNKLQDLQVSIADMHDKTETANSQKNSVEYKEQTLKKQLASIKDESNKKMEILKRKDKCTYEAACWLSDNKHRFKSRIFLPIMLEINVHLSENSKYIENLVPLRDMLAFVCEDKDDCKKLTYILKNEMKLPVNIVLAPTSAVTNSPPLPQELRNYGLECFVTDLFSTPEPVMKYLCACHGLQTVPVARIPVDANKITTIIQTFRRFYSGNIIVIAKKSRYGDKNWSDTQKYISEFHLLVNHDDTVQRKLESELQIIVAELELHITNCKTLTLELAEMEKDQDRYRKERKTLLDSMKQLQNIATQLSLKKSYRLKMSVLIDEEEEKAKLKRKINSVNADRGKLFSEFSDLFKKYKLLQKEAVKHILCMNSLSKELNKVKSENETIHEDVKALQEKMTDLKKKEQEKKELAQKRVDEIEVIKRESDKLDKFFKDDDPGVLAAIQDSLSMPTLTLEQIEEKISHVQAQLNLNEDNEPEAHNVLEAIKQQSGKRIIIHLLDKGNVVLPLSCSILLKEFNARTQEIASIQAGITDLEDKLEDMKQTIEEKKKEWLEPLQHHIKNINRKFSRYFKHLCCAGEISLDIPTNMDDFTNYGLQIKLKFHEDQPFTELSTSHHSGGECSVAAIIFILSLQELTEVPFRCIDEINQGMDSIYERKIYQLIADSVGDDKCSQYFLLTPKLLMNLKYPDDVAVHVIYNSSYLNIKLNIKKLLEVAKSA